MQTLESVQSRAEAESRQAWEFIFHNPTANAREIAEGVDEPAELIEQIIVAMYANGTSITRYRAVEALISAAVRTYANDQAEAAANHIINTPT